MASKRIGIVGASGYTGAELLRLSALHGGFDVAVATGETQAGKLAASRYPSLAAAYPNLVLTPYEPDACEGLDLVFLALPHGAAQGIVPELRKKVGAIVDLSADFRLTDPELYPQWYHEAHQCPELLPEFAYGLPELYRDAIIGSTAIAVPGCYPTAASLALAPLVREGVVDPNGIIVDAASGVSGAGVGLKENTAFCTVDEDFVAYGLLDHRHTPEMEQVIGASVLFTPHLAPMNRGILATCYARPADGTTPTTESLLAVLARAYANEPFIVVRPVPPSTKATLGSNCVHLTARFDRTHGMGHGHRRDRQPREGRVGRRGAMRQPRARPPRDDGPADRRASPVTTTAGAKASTLVEALPYIRRFWDKTVVVKYGGNALAGATDAESGESAALSLFAEDIVLMRAVGMRPVVVHGGGPQISDLMSRLGKVPEFRDGLRVTDAETVDIARMVLVGKVNPGIVSAINVHGALAVGVSGESAGLIEASQQDPALGFVGEVARVNPAILERLLAEDLIPVIATIGSGADGQAYNINADVVAGAVAEALGAEKLVYLTDIEGLRRDANDPATLIRQITAAELDALIADGSLTGGMIPKVGSCVHAVRHGVGRAHILDGRIPHVLLLEIFTDEGIGTMVLPEVRP